MCPSIGGNVGETWLRRGPIITPPPNIGKPMAIDSESLSGLEP